MAATPEEKNKITTSLLNGAKHGINEVNSFEARYGGVQERFFSNTVKV